MDDITYVGLDVHKATVCVAVAESGRGGEVRQVGVFQNRPEILCKMAAKLGRGGRRLSFSYEAGPCGYGRQRLLTACGHSCIVVTPSLIPIKSGDRVKTDRRDAMMLAKLHRAGELTAIWIPDAAHEAIRDLVRARATAGQVLSKARQHLQGFLLRHDRIYRGVRAWTLAYRRWLTTVRFEHPAQQIVLQDYIHAVEDAEARRDRLTRRVLIEGAWTYRMTARVSRKLHDRLEPLSAAIRDIAWKAQVRLCARYRRLAAAGKPKVVVSTAIAREIVGFIWAIARIAQPALA